MKTLQAFWHWVENEKPAAVTTYAARQKTCTEVEMQAVDFALDAVKERNGGQPWNDRTWNEFSGPLRDLSLELCRALEKMHEAIPEAEKVKLPEYEWAKLPGTNLEIPAHRLEEAKEWREEQRRAMAYLYESLKLSNIEAALCSPCHDLGCNPATTLDMLCADCQVKCGLEPKPVLEPLGIHNGLGCDCQKPNDEVTRYVYTQRHVDKLRGERFSKATIYPCLPVDLAFSVMEILEPSANATGSLVYRRLASFHRSPSRA